MMADILLSPALQWALIAGALLFAGLAAFGRTRPLHWALPAGRGTAAAVLDALQKNGIDGAVYQISAADMAALIAD